MMRAALCQTPCALGDKQENLSRMERLLSQQDADLYIFPELFLTGYMVRDDVHRLAEAIDGPSVAAVHRMAAEIGASILFGMAAWDENVPGLLRNSAVMVSPDGRTQRYDKVNLANFGPFEEGFYFGAGNSGTLMDLRSSLFCLMMLDSMGIPWLSQPGI